MTLSIKYDNRFLNNVCNGKTNVAYWRVRDIVTMAETYFKMEKKLGTKVTFDIVEIGHVNEDLSLYELCKGCPGCDADCKM